MVRDGRVMRSHKNGERASADFSKITPRSRLGFISLYELTFDTMWIDARYASSPTR